MNIYIPFLALLFGIFGTTSYHMAKALTKQGIDTFKRDAKGRKKKSAIWIVGFILNNIVTVFQVIALLFGPGSLYTSMFGSGMIVLLFYAHYVLKERITYRELIGAVLIIIGTLAIGIISIFFQNESPIIIYDKFFYSLYFIAPISITMIFIGFKFKKYTIIAYASCGGMISAIGSDFMYVGNVGGGFQPYPFILIVVYIVGLLLGTASFLLSQFAWARDADVSKYVPIHNTFNFLTPFIYEFIIFIVIWNDFLGFLFKLPFIIITLVGLYLIVNVLVKTMKKPKPKEENKN